MSDTFVTIAIESATFASGATLTGGFEAEYNAGGTLIGLSDVALTVAGAGGFETFSSANGDNIFINGAGPGEYQLASTAANSDYGYLYVDWSGEDPTTLNGGGATSVYDEPSGPTDDLLTGATVISETICFLAGTQIRTPDGEVAIETLKRGDLVLTATGDAKPVCWLGKQTIAARFADPRRAWPIRVKAGALAENIPARDLLLSPGHALMLDDTLIIASALVNGSSVVRESRVPEVFIYYHVELEDHALILAENTPAETFIDNVDRGSFDNWNEYLELYPQGKETVAMAYPVAKSPRQIPAGIRAKLAVRAGAPQTAAA